MDFSEALLGRLVRWLRINLGIEGDGVRVDSLVSTGSAVRWSVMCESHRLVMMTSPTYKNDPSASDLAREWTILRALEQGSVPHHRPVAFCEDPEVLGASFLLVDEAAGFISGYELPTLFEQQREELAFAYVDGLVELTLFDWESNGLSDLGKPQGFLERQVGRWRGQLSRYQNRELPEVDHLARWLEENRPVMGAAALMHGDYSPFHVVVAWDAPTRLSAIVDWDTGTIGDPLLDLGHLLARWPDPGEEPIIVVPAGGPDGYPTRGEMAEHYQKRTSRDLTALRYYEVLALFKLAAILEGLYVHEQNVGTPDSANPMTELVPRLLRGAAEFASGQRS